MTNRSILVVLAILAVMVLSADVVDARKWTDLTGKFTVEAELVDVTPDLVRLKREDGRLLEIPLEKLSDADRKYVRGLPAGNSAGTRPATTPSTESAGAAGAAGPSATTTVIAEGVGTSPAEAEKDAFRNAVRQVVGLYVDSDTLVKNDELIDDKVLTYSDGFVRKSEIVPGSEKKQGALHRLKIKAVVERKSVVARLKAVNITVRDVDGKSLFAKALTEIAAEKDACTLLKKALEDLPTLLTAEVVGDPDFDREKSEVVARIVVRADRPAYASFVKRLEEVLGKIAVAKDNTILKGEPGRQREELGGFFNQNQPQFGGPRLRAANQWCVWVNNFNNATHTGLKWNVYVVECDIREIATILEVPTADDHALAGKSELEPNRIHRPSDARTMIVISALDENGELVTEDEVEILAGEDATYSRGNSIVGALPLLRHFCPRDLNGESGSLNYATLTHALSSGDSWKQTRQSVNLFISPYALGVKARGYGWSVGYYPQLQTVRRFKVTLDELKKIKQFKCSVVYKPGR